MFLRTWGEIEERIDPLFYLNMLLLDKNIVRKSNYKVGTFKQLINMQRGRFGHRPRNDPRYYGGKYPFIQTGNIVKASEANNKIEYIQTLNELGLSTSRLFEEKVLVITIAANIGYTAILDYSACFPDSLVALTAKGDDISIEYLNVYIRFIRQYIENLAPQAAQKNINLKQLSILPIIVPDRDVQKKIVAIMDKAYLEKTTKENEAQKLLDSVDDYLLEELGISLPEQSKNTLADRVFFIRSSEVMLDRFDPNYYQGTGHFHSALLSSKYPIVDFGKVITSLNNGVEIREYVDKGYRYLRVSDMSKMGIVNNNMRFVGANAIPQKVRLSNNDLLISRSGSLGLVNVVTEDIIDSILSSHIFKVSIIETVNAYFIQEYLRSSIGQHQFFRNNNGGIIPEINQNALKRIKIILPCVEKQQEIAKYIFGIRARAKSLSEQSNKIIAKAKMEIEKILLGGETLCD